jgi:hypothetical protein
MASASPRPKSITRGIDVSDASGITFSQDNVAIWGHLDASLRSSLKLGFHRRRDQHLTIKLRQQIQLSDQV